MFNESVEGFPVSPQQEHLWQIQKTGAVGPYRAESVWRIEGHLDVAVLESALNEVIRRHEILRTAFVGFQGLQLPLQVITAPRALAPRRCGPGDLEAGTESLDLERGEVLSASLATRSPEEHLLALGLPGLCADATTLDNLMREIVELYRGQAAGLSEEPVQYADVAQFFRQILDSGEAEAGKEHWRRHIARGSPRAMLPLEKSRTGEEPFAPGAIERSLGADIAGRAAAVAHRSKVGVEAFFFACWQVLLRRLTERPNLTVAAAVDGRGHEGLKDALGLFARHLPVPIAATEEAPFTQLIEQAHNSLLTAQRWQEAFSWTLAGDFSGEEPDRLYWPFCFELREPLGGFTTAGLRFSSLTTEARWDRFKLKLVMLRRDDGLTARFEYDSGCLAGTQVERLASAFEALLRACLEHPETQASELPIVGTDEWRQLVFDCNDTRVEHRPGERLHDPFEAQAERTPEAVAVVSGERRMTYRELDRRADRLAHRLRASGVGPESIVAIHLERSFAMVESILAVLKAGGAYLPLDPDYPRERLAFILKDAEASVLVTEESLGSGLPAEATAGVVILYAGEDTEPAETGIFPPREATAENTAYLIYTSGSTGRPKGVVVPHRAIVNRLRWMQREFPLTPADRVLQKTPYGFDASIWELFSPLWAGARLVLAEPGAHRDSSRLVELIIAHGVTRLQLVPSLLKVFLDEPRLDECSSLKHLFCGGEALMSEWRERVFERLDCRLTNLYGPTEAAIDASFHPCLRWAGEGIEPIGRPLDNVRIYLLGPGMQCVATGMAGHLHIGGAGLARGYQGRPDVTAERFLPDFLSGMPGGRLYATGDLARRREDGTIEYLGRIDQQVKVHGVRIELGEIEAVLSEHPGVEEAVVVAQTGESGALRLAAYVVPPRKRSPDPIETLTLPGGLEVAYLNRNETQAIHREIFVDRTYLQHGIELPDGAVVVDAGANIGLFTLFVHQSCEKPRVFAFEPIPPTFARLRRNVELYGLEVELFNCGLGSHPGTATFSFYRNWSGMSGIHADREEDEAMTRALLHNQDRVLAENAGELLEGRFEIDLFSCQMTTLSDVISCHGIEQIDLLKVDVEKSELAVLAGISESDWGKIRQIVLEAHDRDGHLAALTGLLRDHGFEFVVEQDAWLTGTNLYNIYAVRREAGGLARKREPGSPRRLEIIAARAPSAGELRDVLRAKLPEPMVPAHIVFLDGLPRMANGKVDRRALPVPSPSGASDRPEVEPRTPAETLLAGIWSGLLGKEKVSIEDNFFELGGDSILAIQLVSRAKAAGLELNARQVFSHQTIARLAAVAGSRTAVTASPSEVNGPIPLTPAQSWFFAQDFTDSHHFNQAVLLSVHRPLDAGLLARAVRTLVARHDALRLRFERDGQAWIQRLLGADEVDAPLASVDLSSLPAGLYPTGIESVAESVAPSLDLSRGPLLRVVHFDLGPSEPGRLLIVIHHLAVDGVSWRILLEDLETVCERLESGRALVLARATTSFAAWAQRLDEYARTMSLEPELAWWRGECAGLPAADREARAPEVVALRNVSFDLSTRETQALLHEIHAAYRTQINEVLLTALAGALLDRGLAPVIELEGHGREDLVEGVDLSRTVGWFTTLFPVRLELQPFWGPDESIKTVKEHLRAIPRRGIGYGLLRYLRAGEPAVQTLRDLAPPEVCFNYLGQLDQALPPGSRFSAASEGSGPAQSRRTRRSNPIDVNALVLGGCLRVTFHFDAHVRQLSAVQPLAERFHERLLALVAHCRTRIEQRVASYTPEDFPLAGLDQRELDRHLGTEWGIEDVYPLTPLQEGIFFHSLLAPGTGVYVGQLTCTLPADLDSRRFRQAWERLIERHGTLRTAFLWEGLDEPRQAVRKSCALPWQDLDWRGLPADEQQRRFEELRHRDRQASLPLNEAPLMRFSLVRLDREPGFIWTFHHLLMDGWSLPLLVQELGAIYMALAEGREPGLPPAWPFSDYIAWLRRQDPSRLEPFWREEFAGFAAPNSLGIAHPAKTEGASGYAEHRIQVSRELTARLKALAARQKLTLQTITLGAWALLISRYSGEEDVVFGSVVSGRPAALPGVEAMIGIFINTLPVRVRVNGDELLAPWLQRLQERQLARQEFEHSPLARIQRWSEIPAGSPLFETLYAFQNYPTPGEGDSGGLRIGNVRNVEHTNYPITLVLTVVDRISLQLTSDRARVDGDAALRLLQHLATLLAGMAEELERRLGELGLLSPSERHQAIAEWNDTGVSPAREVLLLDLLAARAEQAPELPAVTQGGEQISHGELAARSERLAAHLRTLGVGPDILVALFLERSIDLVVALLAVLKAGGAYLPLDPSLPRPRLSFLLDDARPSLVLTRTRRLPDLPERSFGVVCLDDLPHGAITAGPVARPAADNLAYVLYTSGSTGHPKGVAVTHRGLANYLLWAAEAYPAGEGRGAPVHSPVSFDLTVTGLFLPLLAGRCVHLVPEEEGIEGLAAALAQGGFGLVKLTPAHLEVLERLLPPERVAGSARAFVIGGEALSGEQLAFWRAHAPSLRLINEYGPTETVVGCSIYEVPTSVSPTGPVPIGRPIANTRILILDPWLHPVPIGVPGEIYLGGAGMCRGYLDRPGLTAEMLVPDPFGTWGERLYRTGDLARRLPDGQIEFLGRSDHQVKIRGFRIELGEIEAVLLALPGVRQGVVTVRDQRLVAYVVGDITVEELRRPLFERLPDYMVPAAFLTLAALPLTPNGKVDREALPAPESQRRSQARRRSRHRARTAASYLAPRTPVEEILAGLWAEILGHERVGAADHFFDLGGHSLLATRVISRLRGAFGVEIPMRDLFAAPVLADFAARIETARRSGTVPPAPPLVPVPREGLLPLSFAQQRLWFIDQLEPGSPLYNVAAALRAEGPIEAGVLARSLGEIVRRHEALRTVFALQEGAPVQRIQPPMPCALPVVDLSGLPERRRETVALSLAEEEAARPFDLARGPLLRGVLLRLAGEDHVAALAMHHIVSDGWSMDILVREITAIYAAFAAGKSSPLPELPVQYADFAAWQRSWLHGETLENEISFWRRQLAGLPPRLELPTDRPRPMMQSFRGASRSVRLPTELTRRMQALSRREGATLFMVLLAGFQALLARYSGQEDLAVGTPLAGRNRMEIEGLIGFFVNTLVLRGDLAGEPTFREFLSRVRETALAAYLHQDVPFERLVEELAPQRSLAYTPLFQVIFALQNVPAESLEIENLRLRPVNVEGTTAKFDLTVSISEHDGELIGMVEYATDLYDGTTVDRLIGHFEQLLAGLIEQVDHPAAEVGLLTAAETLQLTIWNATARDYPQACIHELFLEQAERFPGSVALASGGREFTYGDISRRSRRLAYRLRRAGAGPGSLVGLYVENLPEIVVGMLGILEAGSAYVPLDPTYPQERLLFMVEDTHAAVLVAEENLASRLPFRTGLHVELLDCTGASEEEPGPSGPPVSLSSPDDPAYVIYTSGSTGQPKGVVVPHRAVVRLVRETDYIQIGPEDRVAQASNSSFDAATFEVWGALLNGGRLINIDRETLIAPGRLTATLRREGVSVMFVTTALFNQIARQEPAGLATLRFLLFGGEMVDPAAVRAVLRDGPPAFLLHVYGPTETTTFATWHRVESVVPGEPVPIGKPLSNGTLYVLAAGFTPLPVGVPGELYLGGAGLAHGYHDRPDLTAERFVPDPFGPDPGGRLYRTGDLVRQRSDGQVEFLGRLDGQVKIRGFRIEPGEIEAALASLPGTREAAVLVREDKSGDRRVVAYVVGDAPDPTVEELRRSLRERLPDYMLPAAFVKLAAFPLTPNGKVDRRNLPAPEWQNPRNDYLAPRTPIEEILAGIWVELLGLEKVGADDHFFYLGGHSLLATQVLSRLREAFGIEFPLRDLFEAPVLADLAARVEAALRASAGRSTPPLVSVPREVSLPLSFAQQRLWFIDQLDPGSSLYNMPAALRVAGPLAAGVMACCLGEIVRRHEALRTVFAVQGDAPVQVVQAAEPFHLPVVDLAGLPATLAFALAAEETTRPFDLARGPLLRGLLLRLSAVDHVAVLTMHHIASDGWSMGILVREMMELYAAFAERRPSPLAELPVQYADFAVWQHAWLQGEVLDRQLAWWKRLFATLPAPVELPLEGLRPAVPSSRGGSVERLLSPELSRSIEELGHREGTTLFMTLLAALASLLHRYTGQDDLVVGSPIAGRSRRETEGLIGFFLNTLALRINVAGDPTVRELLRRVRGTVLGASDHQDVPFELLLEELRPERELSRTPLFQVVLNWLSFGAGQERFELPGLVLERLPGAEPSAKFDLEIYAAPSGKRIFLSAVYNRDLLASSQVEDLLTHLEALLAGMAAMADRRVSQLPPVVDRSAFRPSPVAAPDAWFPREALDRSIPERFAAQVAAQGESLAVVGPEGAWTYAALAREANRVAHALLAQGAYGERVALLFSPGLPMVAAVLGALAAGATYVPLDRGHPRERLLNIVEDSGAAVLLVGDGLRERAKDLAAERPVLVFGDLPAAPERWRPPAVPAEASAYILYTSGSTGRPKGVLQSQRNVLGYIRLYCLRLGLGPEDCVLLLAQYGFDAAVMDLFGALLTGATLGLWDLRKDGLEGLGRWMSEQKVTVYHSTPSVYRAFLDGLRPGESFPAVRLVVLGGEEARQQDLERFRSVFSPDCLLVNGLGPTESTLALQRFFAGDETISRAGLPVGWPVEDIRIGLRNGAGEQPAIWGVGELEIGSPYLAIGYWGQPHLTAERFLPDPQGVPGARLYRVGDLARRLPDGALEFLRRADGQIKVRGQRIELGEVEAGLLAVDGVRQAIVILREDRLVAYVIGGVPVEALLCSLQERLPESMIPAAFVTLDALPLNANGKLDRRALPAPEWHRSEQEQRAPRTPIEEVLSGIWGGLLGLERVGTADNFFDLGGHSLLATQLVSRVREVFGVELPVRTVFEKPRLAELGAQIEALMREGMPAVPPIRRGAGEPVLSFAQQRLWFVDRLAPGRAAYNIPAALHIRGALDIEALAQAFTTIQERHESLRTTFVERENEPVAVVAPAPLDSMARLTLPAKAVGSWLSEEAARPFDLASGPLVRSVLLRITQDEHVLSLTLHHIIADGWSIGVVIRELVELYTAALTGRPAVLPELAIQYSDFARWQRDLLRGERLTAEIERWRARLSGAPEILDLPVDHPWPEAPSGRGGTHAFRLPADLAEPLRAFARRESVTPFMLLLTGFAALLARWCGQDDLCVGSPIAGRDRRETEGLIGLLVNTLVLRADLRGEPGLRAALQRIRETALDAFAHADLPFEKLVEEMRPERSLARPPLVQATFALQNLPSSEIHLPGLVLEPFAAESGAVKVELSLTLAEVGDGFSGTLAYAADLFEGGTAARMVEGFVRLLAGMVEAEESDPIRPLLDLEILPESERLQLLAEWSAGEDRPTGLPIHELFARQARSTPDAVAVLFEEERWTYGELLRESREVAAWLCGQGVVPGDRVAILAGRSAKRIAWVLGVLAAGAAYVALDPEYPHARTLELLADVAPRLVLADAPPVPALPVSALCPGAPQPTLLPKRPEGTVDADGLAYIVYTSGSTGRPKGIAASHRSAATYLDWVIRNYGLGPGDVALQLAPLTFDASLRDTLAPLAAGGKIVVVPDAVARDPEALLARMSRHAVTCLPSIVPALLRALTTEARSAGPAISSLRLILASGAVLHGSDAAAVRLAFGDGVRLVNQYGPSEAALTSTWHQVLPRDEELPSLPVGRPAASQHLFLLDHRLRPVPRGTAGEIFLGGPGLAFGYLGQPDRTAEVFIPDPFGGPGARLYRTGDRGRFRADGVLELLGRLDLQIKIRGHRVEPGEVEAVLRSHPAVRDVCVAAYRAGADGEPRLTAWVVSGAPAKESREGIIILRAFVAERLPAALIPAEWVHLDALPLTPHGKVDRKALTRQAAEGSQLRSEREVETGVRTPFEDLLAGIWSEVLWLERIGPADDFFHLGGHSLLATQVVSRLRQQFGVDLPLRTLFEEPTLAGLARRVEAAVHKGGSVMAPPIVPVPRDRDLPLSFAQQRLWFLDRLTPDAGAYKLFNALRLEGPLDVPALVLSLGEVARRHESLRTSFPLVNGAPVQRIAAPGRVDLPVLDLTELPPESRRAELGVRTRVAASRPFDLERGPLLQAVLVISRAEEYTLLLSVHHTVCDGWSTEILLRELWICYQDFSRGENPGLPVPLVQFADYAVWQRSWMRDEILEREVAYWRGHLAGIPEVLELPADHPRPPVQTFRGGQLPFALPDELEVLLSAFGRQAGSTLFMTLLAGFGTLMHRYTGEEKIPVGTPIANRTFAELEGVIGNFANTLVLGVSVENHPSFRELVGRVREAALGAYGHQDLPFETLVEVMSPRRDLSYNPLFQVLFALHNLPSSKSHASELRVRPLGRKKTVARFDLALDLAQSPAGVQGSFEYASDLFDAPTIARLAGHLRELLAGAMAAPDLRLLELPLLSAPERHQLLAEWNDSSVDAGLAGCLHELFERWAAQRPEAVAVVCGGERVSYGELDRRAERLARRLRALGISPETPVGVCLERSVEMVMALLGVLKAGGAYVPLDPAYPRQRVAWILESAGVPMVVTRGTLLADLPEPRWRVVDLDGPEPEEMVAPASKVTAAHTAYVIFTSGSTGRPKGVQVTHGSAVHLLETARTRFGFSEEDVWTVAHSYAFDLSVWEIWGALALGGRLVVVPLEVAQSPEELAKLLRGESVTVLNQTPSAIRQLADVVEGGTVPPSLRLVGCGGEAFPRELASWLVSWGIPVWNLYGPTEATVWAAAGLVKDAMTGEGAVPLGRPLPDARLWVLGPAAEPLPVGAPGELCIGGPGLARGYFRDPALTAAAFVPNTFAAGERLYRTGDRVRRLPDGGLEFLGRIDHQVKVRGFRIELGEIEAALVQHPAVRQVAVVAADMAPGDRGLVAYLVPAGDLPGTDELRRLVLSRLPSYMAPSRFIALDALPLTPHGKVDRSRLPAPARARAASRRPPRDPVELQLACLWEDLLKVAPVGVEDDFFALGGHSLAAVRLMAGVHRLCGREIPVSELFRRPTIAALAELLRGLEAGEPPSSSPLVLLASGRAEETPLFCIHGASGNAMVFADLARALVSDRTVYGLEARGLIGGEDILESVEEMAELYLAAVREVRPHGPYRLLGYSMGSKIAFEMSRRLEMAGESVELLALLDVAAVVPAEFTREGTEVPAEIRELPDFDSEIARRHLDVLHANRKASRCWTPKAYPGKALLFVTAPEDPSGKSTVDPTLGWGGVILGGVDVIPAPGDHFSLLRAPHVEALVKRL